MRLALCPATQVVVGECAVFGPAKRGLSVNKRTGCFVHQPNVKTSRCMASLVSQPSLDASEEVVAANHLQIRVAQAAILRVLDVNAVRRCDRG